MSLSFADVITLAALESRLYASLTLLINTLDRIRKLMFIARRFTHLTVTLEFDIINNEL